MKVLPLAGIACSLFVASAAFGVINQVFDPASLNMGPYTLEEFEDPVLEPGVTYTTPGNAYPTNPFLVLHVNGSGGVGPSGVQGLGASPGPMIIDFDVPTTSMGFWIGNDEPGVGPFDAILTIYDAGGVIGSITVRTNANDWIDQFMGFNAPGEAVTRVSLDYGNNLAEYIDDFYYNVIPGPGSLALLAVAGLACRRRRR